MSCQNHKYQKRLRSVGRAIQKNKAAQTIPCLGVGVRAIDVRRHRYLRDHSLPHSLSLSNVMIRQDAVTNPEMAA